MLRILDPAQLVTEDRTRKARVALGSRELDWAPCPSKRVIGETCCISLDCRPRVGYTVFGVGGKEDCMVPRTFSQPPCYLLPAFLSWHGLGVSGTGHSVRKARHGAHQGAQPKLPNLCCGRCVEAGALGAVAWLCQVEECLERAFRLPGTAVDIFAAAAKLAEGASCCLSPLRLSR